MEPARAFDAVILTGGSGRRLGGVDKSALRRDGASLVDRIREAVDAAGVVVCVGEAQPTTRPVVWVREDPPHGGPAAALMAGVAHTEEEWIVVLAVDLPFVTEQTVARLVVAADRDGAVLIDGDGRRQHLCAAYRREALVIRADGNCHGMPMRRLVADLDLVEIPAVADEAVDVDLPADLRHVDADSWPIAHRDPERES
jgi:molybdopterin-guanine dinucleotide biosynthesis protein A